MTFQLAESASRARIKVFGVGGGGGNAVNTMIEGNLAGVDFVSGNTDVQALETSLADIRLQLGPTLAKGLGAGANPEVGRESAEENADEIRSLVQDSDMVFVTAGLGGGTGTGAAPVVARICKEVGALTVAVVTRPFSFVGRVRAKNADKGWELLKQHADTIITIPNDRLISLSGKSTRFIDGMKMADEVLVQAVKGITDMINLPGYINPDFADLRAVMNEMGPALMGAGEASGESRAAEAVNRAIASPLLQDISIDGAKGVLVNISSREDTLTMAEVTEVTTRIQEEVHEDANIILGVIFDDGLADALRVTVIATGIRTPGEMEGVQDKVTPLVQKTDETTAGEDGAEEEPESGRGISFSSAARQRKPFPQSFFDEDTLDRPTFLRRNES
jgi:cell division protein FtsZ